MKIGLLTPAWPGGQTPNGIATAVRHLAHGLKRLGHTPVILAISIDAPHDDPHVIEVGKGIWHLRDKLRKRFSHTGFVAQDVVARAIATAAMNAINDHGIEALVMEETQGWAETVAEAVPIPVVVTLHGPWCIHKKLQSRVTPKYDARREAREIAGLRAAAMVTAPAATVLADTLAAYDLNSLPAVVIPNPMPLRDALDYGKLNTVERQSLFFVGRFDKHKGGDNVIEAFGKVAGEWPSARLTFVGPDRGFHRPDGRQWLINDALAELPGDVRERVDYRGVCGRDEIERLRRSHGVSIVASRYEIFGYTLFEALASGVAVICTQTGGPGDYLEDGETALLVPPEDPHALARAMARCISEPEVLQDLGTRGREFVGSAVAPENVAAQLVAVIRDLL